MEMQFNGMILRNNFLLVTNNRPIKSSNNGIYLFLDGSKADLNLGLIISDTKIGSPQALILHVLTPGKQTFSTGVKNEKPETKTWSASNIDIDYDGDIIILPTTNNEITVAENEFCFANEERGVIYITSSNYTTVTIDTINTSFSNISGGRKTPLRIAAPTNTTITNRSGKLIFDQLDEIVLLGGDLEGTKVNTVKGTVTKRAVIKILNLGSLTVETNNALTLSVDSANILDLKSDSRLELNVKSMVNRVKIDSSGASNITGGNYQNIDIEQSGGALSIKNVLHIEQLVISADSSVNINGQTAGIIYIKEADGRVDINLDSCESITSNSDSALTAKVKNLKIIDVIYADGRVEIETENSESIKVKSDSAVSISSNKIDNVDIVYADGRVDIKADTLSSVSINSDSAVNISCKNGEQSIKVENDGRVDLTLAVAKSVTVTTDSAVQVTAYKYLSDPRISTSGRKTVEVRK